MKKIPNINNHIFKQPNLPWSTQSWHTLSISAFAKSTTEILFNFNDVLADSYDYEVSTSSSFNTLVVSANVLTNAQVDISGLTIDTQYFIRVRSNKADYTSSDWVTANITTLPVIPLHFYMFQGIAYDGTDGVTNEYGKTTTPTETSVDEVYSVLGSTANTLTPVSTIGTIQLDDTTPGRVNQQTSTSRMSNNNEYAFASGVNLTGDFTILVQGSSNNSSASIRKRIITNADNTQDIEISTTSIGFRHGSGNNFFTPPSNILQNGIQTYVFKRVGTTVYCSVDGGLTYTSATGAHTETWAFTKLFVAGTEWYVTKIGIFTQDLTAAQIAKFIDIDKQPDRTIPSSQTLIPTGITFTSLTGDYYVNAELISKSTAAFHRQRAWSRGDYSYLSVSKSTDPTDLPTAGKDCLVLAYKHSTSKIAVGAETGVPADRYEYDTHDDGTIFLTEDHLYHTMMTDHYDNGVDNTLIMFKSGNDLNISSLNRPVNPFIFTLAGDTQYHQYVKSHNYDCLICQDWAISSARHIDLFRSKDGFNTFEKIRITDIGDTLSWFYPRSVYAEDGKIRVIFSHINLTTGRYLGIYYMESNDDGDTWTTLDGTSVGDVSSGNAPILLSEMQAIPNCYILDGAAKTFSTGMIRAFHDPTDGEIYYTSTNGDNDAINFGYSSGGSWVNTDIDNLTRDIVHGIYLDDTHYPSHTADNVPFVVRRGGDVYDAYLSDIVDFATNDIVRIVRFRTIDKGVTWTDEGVVSDDITKTHFRMEATANMHYTGGTTAYNGKKILMASREVYTGATNSDVFIKDIT